MTRHINLRFALSISFDSQYGPDVRVIFTFTFRGKTRIRILNPGGHVRGLAAFAIYKYFMSGHSLSLAHRPHLATVHVLGKVRQSG